jgi:hypothetical protein
MFLINGNPLQIDTPFTDAEGNQYPSNWIRFATDADKARVGITEVADAVRASDVFYWDGNIENPKALEDKPEFKEDGTPLYVQKYNPVTNKMEDTTVQVVTKGLKSNFIAQVRNTAYTILLQTDWAVVRKAERAIEIPADITTYRAEVLSTLDDLETAIAAVTTVEELADLNLSFPSKD